MPAAGKGRPSGSVTKPWKEALELALKRPMSDSDPRKKLAVVAEAVVNAAASGDMQAAREIGDRLDGKPVQGIGGSDGGDLVVKVLTGIARD